MLQNKAKLKTSKKTLIRQNTKGMQSRSAHMWQSAEGTSHKPGAEIAGRGRAHRGHSHSWDLVPIHPLGAALRGSHAHLGTPGGVKPFIGDGSREISSLLLSGWVFLWQLFICFYF